MRIAVFEIEDWERKAFERLKDGHDVQFVEGPLNAESAGRFEDCEIVSTFIYSDLDDAVLKQLDRLRMISTRSTGYDHIDLQVCKDRKVAVCNVPEYGENTVAEHVFGLLLTVSHHLYEAIDRTRKGDFSLQGLRGFDLRGKTLGVIGTGSIGRCVIGIARGFGMKVLAFDMKPDRDLERSGVRYASLDDLLAGSDVVTLHVPGGEKTRNLISGREFAGMKDGAVLVNTSRGSVVDVKALVRALADGKVSAAGLDVLPEEPAVKEEAELIRSIFTKQYDLEALLSDHILLRLRNVYITPHSAFNTREALERILETTVDNIRSFIAGNPRNCVG